MRRAGGDDLPGRAADVDRAREGVDGLVELERHRPRSRRQPRAVRRDTLEQDCVGERGGRQRECDENRRRQRLRSHRAPASGDRCPKIGATLRSQKSSAATATIITANPALKTGDRGWTARPRQTAEPASSVHPRAWCRKAEREKNHGFCSWIRKASPETTSASG